MFCKKLYRKKKTPSLAFSNNFTHLQIIIQKKKIHFIKILPLVFNSYGFILTVRLEPNVTRFIYYGFVLFLSCASKGKSGQNANVVLKIHSP